MDNEERVIHGLIVGGVVKRFIVVKDETVWGATGLGRDPAWRVVDLETMDVVAAFFAPTNKGTAEERCRAFVDTYNATGVPDEAEDVCPDCGGDHDRIDRREGCKS